MIDEKGKKPNLAVLIALKAKDKMSAEPDRKSDSAQELLDAIKAGDAEEFGSLLHAFVLSCMDEQGSDEEDEEEESD